MNEKCNKRSFLKDEIVAMAGYWEPDAFIIRGGRASKDIEENNYPYSEEMVKKLSRIGITLAVWPYYKGLGIETEKEQMQKTAHFFKFLEKYGLKRGVYINLGSIFADTFLVENPEAESWLSCDQDGKPQQYSEFYRVYYRLRPCMSNTGFGEYVGKAAVKAIKEAKADHILFDNSGQVPCYCEKCRKGLPEYVLRKFPQKAEKGRLSFKQRFGYEFMGRFELPRGTARMPIDNLPGAHEPGLYEWVRFRQEQYEKVHEKASVLIRAASDSAEISWNVALDYGEFTGLVWGIDPETAYRCKSDLFFSEDENYAGIEDGRLITHIRTYRYGRAMENKVFIHNIPGGSGSRKLLNYAEAAVFNDGCLGRVMWGTDEEKHFDTLKSALTFFKANKEVFLGTKPLSKVALYRCSESETIHWADAVLSRYAVEQVLIKNSIQFDYVINDTIDNITDYELLICANTMSVSDANLGKIADFVRKGGKVLCTDSSFCNDEYGRKRISDPDMGLFGERDDSFGHKSCNTDMLRILSYLKLDNSYEKNIFSLPSVELAIPFNWDIRSNRHPVLGKEYYAEPLNRDELLSLVKQALPEDNIEVSAPENVIAGYFETEDGALVIHMLDYEAGRTLTGIRLRFRIGEDKPTEATFKDLDGETKVPLTYYGNYAQCILPAFEAYGFLKLEKAK